MCIWEDSGDVHGCVAMCLHVYGCAYVVVKYLHVCVCKDEHGSLCLVSEYVGICKTSLHVSVLQVVAVVVIVVVVLGRKCSPLDRRLWTSYHLALWLCHDALLRGSTLKALQ